MPTILSPNITGRHAHLNDQSAIRWCATVSPVNNCALDDIQLSDTNSIPPIHGGFLLILRLLIFWCMAKCEFLLKFPLSYKTVHFYRMAWHPSTTMCAYQWAFFPCAGINPDNKVHGVNMGPIWGRQGPGGPMLAPWTLLSGKPCQPHSPAQWHCRTHEKRSTRIWFQ